MSDTATPSPDPLSQTEFLQIRSRLLDLAAALDRAQRAGWNRDRDARGEKIAEAFQFRVSEATIARRVKRLGACDF